MSSSKSTTPAAAGQALALAALVAVNAAVAAPSLALPPMNCNSFGCYPVGVNPGGGTARDEPRTGPTPTPTLTLAAANAGGGPPPAFAAALPNAQEVPMPIMSPPGVTAMSSERAVAVAKALEANGAKVGIYGWFVVLCFMVIVVFRSRRWISLFITYCTHLRQMYGAYWCSHCYEQKQKLGKEAMKYITYVECAKDGLNSQTKTCKANEIPGYPTWKVILLHQPTMLIWFLLILLSDARLSL